MDFSFQGFRGGWTRWGKAQEGRTRIAWAWVWQR
ncbi:hypothetical protein FOCG_06664 [Fusarium oxysporum f. sp. radicis-lycopersici 26381]|uniref:Uncharacterized protein n=1 Tax=Fusarium oxysporum Fo47 TaxID=660027 RepID=W9KU49_FUSOX|nr:hypothetical protein FOZG_03722 [Fusarium oxysporum Fo47]EWZ93053.1 hypothetical protein FOWG_05961 [Fusarium oxysporum f. sp. lycopersici MN25]EXL53335.1 hypothetical protein FOCG_06664 [Fusarium oxysporum f. sp. radicis-lycopersici 26381]